MEFDSARRKTEHTGPRFAHQYDDPVVLFRATSWTGNASKAMVLRNVLLVMPERDSTADVVSLMPAEDEPMLYWAILFLIIGVIAAIFGFGGIAGVAIGIAKVVFFIFIALFIIFLILGFTAFRRLFRRL